MFSLLTRRVVVRSFTPQLLTRLCAPHALSRTFLTTALAGEPAGTPKKGADSATKVPRTRKVTTAKAAGTAKAKGTTKAAATTKKKTAAKKPATKAKPARKPAKKPAPKPVTLATMKLTAADKPPPRGPTAYALHVKDTAAKLRETQTGKLTVAEISATSRDAWANLSETEKKEYAARAAELQLAQRAKRDEYLRTVDPQILRAYNIQRRAKGRSSIRAPENARKPLGPYLRYFMEKLSTVDYPADLPGLEKAHWATRQAAAEWKAMSEDEKKPYFAAFEAAKAERLKVSAET